MNLARRVLFSLSALLLITVAAQAASPVDRLWGTAVNNGFTGSLMINVNNSGIVSGTAFNDPISGFWDQATGKLVFYRAINHVVINNQVQINPENIQIFTGYLFHYKAPGAFFSDTQVLAGTFESFAGTGATQQKNTFSWFAYRPQP